MSAEVAQNGGAPRGETGLYGEPVAEWEQGESSYFEAYVNDDNQRHIFVAEYVEDSGEWVKVGMEKMSLSEIFNHAQSLRRGQ